MWPPPVTSQHGLPPSPGSSRPPSQRFCRTRRSPATWCAGRTNLKALAKWCKRTTTPNSARGQSRPRSRVLNELQDATSVASRPRMLRLLVDGLGARARASQSSYAGVFLDALDDRSLIKTKDESNLGRCASAREADQMIHQAQA